MPDPILNPVVPPTFDPGALAASTAPAETNIDTLLKSAAEGTSNFLSGLVKEAGPEAPSAEAALSADAAIPPLPNTVEPSVPEDPLAAPPAPKADAKPVADPDLPPRDLIKGTTSEHWRKLHDKYDAVVAEREAARKEAAALKEQLTKPRDIDPDVAKRLDEAMKERDLYSAKLESVAIELHPKFEATFKPRVDSAIQLAAQQVGAEHREQVAKLMAAPPSEIRDAQLEELGSQLSGIRQGRFNSAIAAMDGIHAERAHLVANGRGVLKQWQQEAEQQRAAAAKQRSEQVETTFNQQWQEKWSGKLNICTERPNDTAHNEGVKAIMETAKKFYAGNQPLSEVADACVKAALFDKLAAQNKALLAQLSEYAKSHDAVRRSGASAGMAAAGAASAAPAAPVLDSNMTAAEAMMQAAARAGLVR